MFSSLQRPLILCLLLIGLLPPPTTGQIGRVAGTVLEAENRRPVRFVRVSLVDSTAIVLQTTETDSLGTFAIQVTGAGPYVLRFHRAGFRDVTKRNVVPEGSGQVIVIMVADPYWMEEVIVESPSRNPEPFLEAPASTSVLGPTQLEAASVLTPVDPTRTTPGMDFASKGMLQSTFAVRGHRSVTSGALLLMTDYRYAGVPALDINVPYLMAVSKEDMERIEIVRGPSSALYGPNSDRGILHVITKAPIESKGTSLAVTVGGRNVLRGRFWHAGSAGSAFGYRISGQYFRGEDWPFVDPTAEAQRQMQLDAGADPDTLRIGRRNDSIQQAAGELRVDWNSAPGTVWSLTAGLADAINIVDLTPDLGGVQVQDWVYPYAQLRMSRGELSFNAFYNGSSSGNTFDLRTGYPLKDDSWLSAIQFQYTSFFARTRLIYGVDARHTEPRTQGTINGRNEADDAMTELGAYVSGDRSLTEKLTLVGALRGDYHDRINNVAVSPRLGVVFNPTDRQAFRLTYNRAFSSPDATSLFIDVGRGAWDPFSYEVRVSAVPRDGFTFARNCGDGLCMQTPWELPANLPADATRTWEVLGTLLPQYASDLSQCPAPDATTVGTDLRLLAPDGSTLIPVQPSEVLDVPGPVRVTRNSLEAGYSGVLAGRIALSTDIYWSNIRDNRGPPRTITPSVFFNQETLEAYLVSNNVHPDTAAAIAAAVSQLPMGTVSPEQVGGSSDILIVTNQEGSYSYSFWGIDVGAEVNLFKNLFLGGDYSFLSKNVIEGVDIVNTVVLDVPLHKGAAWLQYRNPEHGWSAGLAGRAVGEFPVDSGVYKGTVDAYMVLDMTFGYRLSRIPSVALSLDASNIFDNKHQEYVGAAEIGRLIMLNLEVGF